METTNINAEKLTHKDFVSGQDVRWCPGCGDYSVLAQVQRSFPDIGKKKEDIVWISGIGCSSRFPYYMGTYGFHGIHGRAPAIASGLKIARPELSVWVATGDGDLMSIGGNHFIHTCRKNIDIKIVMFNNRIYGLTKGQYSPTSEQGKVTKSSPFGSVDYPFNPTSLALGAVASFVAKTVDREPKHLKEMLKRAADHKGTAFVEVLQNCVIFNDHAFDDITDKQLKKDKLLFLEHEKPMVFGTNNDKGIVLEGFQPKVVDLNSGEYTIDDVWVHDEKDTNPARAYILAHMDEDPDLPTPLGVFRKIDKPTYDEGVENQVNYVTEKKGKGTLKDLLYTANTWQSDGNGHSGT